MRAYVMQYNAGRILTPTRLVADVCIGRHSFDLHRQSVEQLIQCIRNNEDNHTTNKKYTGFVLVVILIFAVTVSQDIEYGRSSDEKRDHS